MEFAVIRISGWSICFILVLSCSQLRAQARYTVELRSGMRLGPGTVEPTDSVSANIYSRATSGEGVSKIIDVLNDGWRRTYYNASPRNIISAAPDNNIPFEPIVFPAASEAEKSGNFLRSARILRMDAFKPTGRRSLTLEKGTGKTVTVIQQITELHPDYVRLELLHGADERLTWDSREALTSILNGDQLQAVLEYNLDLSKPTEWERMYSFYVSANRFAEAIRVLKEGLRRFPAELGPRKNLLAQTTQLLANQQFDEIAIRREAGQWKLASQLLSAFPKDLLETQINAKNQLDRLRQDLQLIQRVVTSLQERVDKLPESDQAAIQSTVDELTHEISVDSAVRLDDYIRLSNNDSTANENMVALALGGWLLGSGSGLQNFAVAKSIIQVRKLASDYLREADPANRESIVNQLRNEEGSQPQYLAKIINNMKPPLSLPDHYPEDPPELFRQQFKLATGEEIEYLIQLPPEYDPNRKYPCILALPGNGLQYEAKIPIDFWCGSLVSLTGVAPMRFGQATRFGYIVICPNWQVEQRWKYNYTEGEKQRILACYRDAQRRSSINTDRTFISGHFEGATAAWDIAQSHPDLWAGVILFSPTAEKYILQYHTNLQARREAPEQVPVATYIVIGQLDNMLEAYLDITGTADKYLRDSFFDTLMVEHIGQDRGSTLFSAELPRIFQWMQLSTHQRIRVPRYIDCVSMRPGDRMFYWLEARQLLPDVISNSFQYDKNRDPNNKGRFEAAILDSSLNGIRVSKIPSHDRSAIVWLSPEMVDFSRDVNITLRDKKVRHTPAGKLEVMLEDVRTRADRNYFFWDVVAIGAGK